MSLREKVGQRIIISFDGTELSPELAQFIIDWRVGGVIYFGPNLSNLEQVRRLNNDFQRLALENNLPPLILSLDEEGGRVSRMPVEGIPFTAPSQMAQAAAGPGSARLCAISTARRLKYLGFNLAYTPVLDINNNPANPVIGTRSFGSNPEMVSQMAVEAIEGYLAENFAPCPKHFPGHGDTAVDSHLGLPVVNKSLEELFKMELVPFKQAIAAGAPAIMTAHITFPEIEPQNLPATLSPFFLGENGLLRGNLGFKGLIFTDALVMQAISDTYGQEEACLLALKAGADIVMPLGSLEIQRSCLEAMLKAAEKGEFELEASAARLEAFKTRFCPPSKEVIALSGEKAVVEEVAAKSITLFRNRGNLLPLIPERFKKPILLNFKLAQLSPVEDERGRAISNLFDLLSPVLPELELVEIPLFFNQEEADQFLKKAGESDLLILMGRNVSTRENSTNLIKRILKLDIPSIFIAARDPYDLGVFEASVCLATYGEPLCSLKALAGLLEGKFLPTGTLPVEIDGPD